MIRKWSSLLFLFIGSVCPSEASSASTVNIEEGQILYHFLRMGIEEEEYGYVLEGIKPISIRSFYGLDQFPLYKEGERNENEWMKTLLARSAIPIWNKWCGHQKNFILKATPLAPSEGTVSGLKVEFINFPLLKEVIQKNIDLFRYILGPTLQSDHLAQKIAYSDKQLIDVLEGNLVLMGIVLGFGSYNSLVGGHLETLYACSFSRDDPPFSPRSYFMQYSGNDSAIFLPPECYGGGYLEFAAGVDCLNGRNRPLPLDLKPYPSNLEQEVMKINALEEQLPSSLLKEFPCFVFGAYRKGPANGPFFIQLQQIQKELQMLLKSPDFFRQVLEKIGGNRPHMMMDPHLFAKPPHLLNRLDKTDWIQILSSVIDRFKEEKEKTAFIQAFCCPSASSQVGPEMMGASHPLLEGLKKALDNLSRANVRLKALPEQEEGLQQIIPDRLYFKITQPGQGKVLQQAHRVRLGYIIEDPKGEILFANYDTWLPLSQMISGFAHGVQGMKIGEKRTLFIHPAFGYGSLTTLPPCIDLTIKVHLLDIDESDLSFLPPLIPLDLSWLQNPSFWSKIETSLEKLPSFSGAFYRKIINPVESLDLPSLMTDIQNLSKSTVLLRDIKRESP